MIEDQAYSSASAGCRISVRSTRACCLRADAAKAVRKWSRRLVRRDFLLGILLVLALPLSGCATTGAGAGQSTDSGDDTVYDPFESYNRVIFRFNDEFDRFVLKPVAEAYSDVLPRPVKNSVSRFFNNLLGPTVVVNDLLQGKVKRSAADTGRFVINSTIGVVGLFDPAKPLGLSPHNEDFGLTLGVWGLHAGPYIVWPILGPSNLRDSIGLVGDYYTYPVNYLKDSKTRWGLRILDAVDTRANLLGATNVLEEAAGPDRYLFIREAYFQHRLNQIYDGNPPQPKFDDEPMDDSATPSDGGGAPPPVPASNPKDQALPPH
ncbi:MAG: MlaA family lipoprotein [Acidiferrobacterales bacterium]